MVRVRSHLDRTQANVTEHWHHQSTISCTEHPGSCALEVIYPRTQEAEEQSARHCCLAVKSNCTPACNLVQPGCFLKCKGWRKYERSGCWLMGRWLGKLKLNPTITTDPYLNSLSSVDAVVRLWDYLDSICCVISGDLSAGGFCPWHQLDPI